MRIPISNIEPELSATEQLGAVHELLNLLTNSRHAIEKSEGKRWIKVGIRDLGDMVEMSVTDSGPGIPDGIQDRIMEAFFTTKPKGIGTGLGLSISRKIVASHGGELKLDPSSPNTRFVWTLRKELEANGASDKIYT